MKEQWREVVGYEGVYEVSNHGRVRSVDRVLEFMSKHGTIGKKFSKGKELSQHKSRGYMGVMLYNSSTPENKRRFKGVHVLVAAAFLDKPEWADRVNHMDLDRSNNHVSNLEWTDHTGNIRHAIENGRQLGVCGERNHGAVLTEDDVRWMRANAESNGGSFTRREIAERFDISLSGINSAINGTTWKHVQ